MSWNAASTATGYEVYGSSYIAAVLHPTLQYTVTGLSPGTAYCFHVLAANAAGASPLSGPACTFTKPATPAWHAAVALGPYSIRVSWASTLGATGYEVYGSSYIAAVLAPTTQYVVTVPQANTTYCFHVLAANGSGASPLSGPACATTPSAITSAQPSAKQSSWTYRAWFVLLEPIPFVPGYVDVQIDLANARAIYQPPGPTPSVAWFAPTIIATKTVYNPSGINWANSLTSMSLGGSPIHGYMSYFQYAPPGSAGTPYGLGCNSIPAYHRCWRGVVDWSASTASQLQASLQFSAGHPWYLGPPPYSQNNPTVGHTWW